MGLSLQNKLRRYLGMYRAISNWPGYLLYKLRNNSQPFRFQCRNGLELTVQKEMIFIFKEIFFDRVYTRELPKPWWQTPSPVVVDIGANLGYFSLLMATEKPDATIHSFEPMPANYLELKRHHSGFPEIDWHIYREAVGNRRTMELNYEDPEKVTFSASVFQSWSPNTKKMVVNSRSLPQLVEEINLEKIDFLKMDCEGSEYEILYSLPEPIFDKIGYIAIETHITDREDHDHQSLLTFVQKKGFQTKSFVGEKTGFVWASRG